MARITVVRIVRRGKFRTRVETSDGKILVLDNGGVPPYVGMELAIEGVSAEVGEIRPLRPGDRWPQMLDAVDGFE